MHIICPHSLALFSRMEFSFPACKISREFFGVWPNRVCLTPLLIYGLLVQYILHSPVEVELSTLQSHTVLHLIQEMGKNAGLVWPPFVRSNLTSLDDKPGAPTWASEARTIKVLLHSQGVFPIRPLCLCRQIFLPLFRFCSQTTQTRFQNLWNNLFVVKKAGTV